MSDEDCIASREDSDRPAEDDDFEETLEMLIKLAQSERRDFLAYLLRIALIEARNHAADKTSRPH